MPKPISRVETSDAGIGGHLDAVVPSPEQRRSVNESLVQAGYAVNVVCAILNYPRSTYYRPTKSRADNELCAAIRDVVG